VVICLERGANKFAYGPADATSSLAPVKSRMVYLSGASLPGLSWKTRPLNRCSSSVACYAYQVVIMPLLTYTNFKWRCAFLLVLVGVNGVVNYNRGSSAAPMHGDHQKRQRNYRLIVDPALKQGPTKVYRIEGHIPGVSAVTAILTLL